MVDFTFDALDAYARNFLGATLARLKEREEEFATAVIDCCNLMSKNFGSPSIRGLSQQQRSRLIFECLVFSAYLAALSAGRHITKRDWFRTRPDFEKLKVFHGALGHHLTDLFQFTEFRTLREVVTIQYDPELKRALAESIDPVNRLQGYLNVHARKPVDGI